MSQTPTDLKALRDAGELQITWADGHVSRFSFVDLRGACHCARCVDEITGERLLDLSTISPEITVLDMRLVGNYAVRIHWSDGHDTGLYTWERLRELSF